MDHCSKCYRTLQPGFGCPECQAKTGGRILGWFVIAVIALMIIAMFARAEDLKSPVPPSAEERIALMDLAQKALVADNALKQATLDYLDRLEKQKTAMTTYESARNEAIKKAGCSLDSKFQCIPVQAAAKMPKPEKKP
jgi:hypothetical protein